MSRVFELGRAYCATPTMRGAPGAVAVVVQRTARRARLLVIDSVVECDVQRSDACDREFMSVRTDRGDFTLSAACRIDVDTGRVRELI